MELQNNVLVCTNYTYGHHDFILYLNAMYRNKQDDIIIIFSFNR